MIRVKDILYGIGGIILGIILFFAGINMIMNPDQVSCGGQTMSQSDTCLHYSKGVQTNVNNYDQEKQSNKGTSIFLIILGLLMLIGCIFLLRSGLRKRPLSHPIPNATPTRVNRQPPSGV